MSFDKDINQTIASAVNAKIEGSVMEALASDDVMKAHVVAALQEPVTDRWGNRDKGETYLGKIIKEAIKKNTQAVVAEEVDKLQDVIRKDVREAIAKSIGVITDSLVSGFVENISGRYPRVEVTFSDRDL